VAINRTTTYSVLLSIEKLTLSNELLCKIDKFGHIESYF